MNIFSYLFLLGGIGLIFLILLYMSSKKAGDKVICFSIVLFTTIAANLPITSVEDNFMGGAYPGLQIWIIDIPILILLFRTFFKKNDSLHFNKIQLVYGLLICWELVCVVIANYKVDAFFQLLLTIKGGLLIYLLSQYLDEEKKIKSTVNFIGWVLAFHILYGLGQWINQGPFGLSVYGEFAAKNQHLNFLQGYEIGGLSVGKYVSGLTGMPTPLTSIIIMYGSLYLAKVFFIDKSIIKGISFFTLFTLVVILTFTRSGWIGWFLSSSILLYHTVFRSNNNKLKLIVIIAIITISIFLYPIYRTALTGDTIYSSGLSRLALLHIYFDQITSNPFLGVGLNNSVKIMANTAGGSFWYGPQPVHNIIILYLVETGLIGLTLFLTLWYKSLKQAFNIYKENYSKYSKAFSLGIFAGLSGLLLQGQFTWTFRYPTVFTTFCIIIGLLIAIHKSKFH